jgi:uncharacterized protein YchJ
LHRSICETYVGAHNRRYCGRKVFKVFNHDFIVDEWEDTKTSSDRGDSTRAAKDTSNGLGIDIGVENAEDTSQNVEVDFRAGEISGSEDPWSQENPTSK